jgi:hypothetical protein
MLAPEEIDDYLAPMTEHQNASIRAVRRLITELNPDLIEEIDTGKWFGGKLVYYTSDRIHVFALGPLLDGFSTFHMMAYYGSPALQERHGADLKKLLTGKSCIKFRDFSQIPEPAIRDIISATPIYAETARAFLAKRKPAAKSKKQVV